MRSWPMLSEAVPNGFSESLVAEIKIGQQLLGGNNV
jgi:hypothetical protein